MRKRFKIKDLNRICSSDNYEESKKLGIINAQKAHNNFCLMAVSGILQLDIPKTDNTGFRTITINGKQMKVTVEEFNWYQNFKSVK